MYAISLQLASYGRMCSTMQARQTGATYVPRLLSPREMAKQSGWPESRIRRLINSRRLRHVRLDGLLLVPEDAIEEFMAANMVEPEVVRGAA